MTDEHFEESLKHRLKKRSVTVSKSKKYDRTYERLLRHCHDNNVEMSPFIWETLEKFLQYQMNKE